MAQVINTNIASLNAQRNLNSSQAGTNQALQRLSSGLRINSAKDDAAGLAISTRFESQIKGLNVAVRNAGDGVSLAQTAEGALGSMTESLQRIRELALQAANGTNSTADRQALNAEAQLLIEEVSRVSTGANFNGVNLLDGSLNTSFQVGANAGETISVSIGKLTADTLGVSTKNGVSATGSNSALQVGDLVINGVTVGASRASDDSASTVGASASAISKAAAINRVSDQSGVTAVVDTNVAAGSRMTAAAVSGGSVTINGTEIAIDTTGSAASTRSAVVTAINAQSSLTGVTAVDSGDDNLGVSLVAADGRNIDVAFDGGLTAGNTGLAAQGNYTGGLTLVANSGTNSINISGANTANAGVAAGSYTAGVATVSTNRVELGQNAVAVAGDFSAFAGYDFSPTTTGTASEIAGAVAAYDFSNVGEVALTGTETAADVVAALNLGATIEINVDNGAGADADVLLNNLFFTEETLVADINQQLAAGGVTNITASIDADTGVLVFTNSDVGAGNDITITELNVGDAAALGFAIGGNDVATGADDQSATFTLTVGTESREVTLDADYTDEQGLANYINSQIAGLGVQASFSGGNLTFTETPDVNGVYSGVEVSFAIDGSSSAAGALVLTALDNESNTGTAGTSEALTFDISVNGQAAQTININGDLTGATAEDVADAINAQLTLAGLDGDVVASINDDGALVFTSSAQGSAATIEISNVSEPASLAAEFTFEAVSASGAPRGADQYKNLEAGDLVINGVAIGAANAADDQASYSAADSSSKEASGISIAAAINRASDSTGVTANVNATQVVGSASTAGTQGTSGTLYINGTEVTLTVQSDADANRAQAVSQINAVSGQTGVVAEDNGSSVTLTATDGRNIVMSMDTQGGASAANFGLGGVGEADFSDGGATGLARANTEANTTYSTVTLSSAGEINVSGGNNGNDALTALGFKAGSFGGAESGQYLNQVDISTQKGATDALATIDNALNAVNAARADLGAVQNRFEATISNLQVNSENLSAANSRIRDADFAAEAANLARSQVLQQAGISILAQANASGQQVLSLLQ